MAKKQSREGKRRVPKTVLRLPDLDLAKSAVLNSLSSIDAQREYSHAIDEFIEMVLLGTAALVQQDRRPPLSYPPGVSASGTRHDQSAPPRYAVSLTRRPSGLRRPPTAVIDFPH